MAYLAGDLVVDSVLVLDEAGAPVSSTPSSVFTSTVYYRPDGAQGVPDVVLLANGVYSVRFQTQAGLPGTWTVVLVDQFGKQYLQTYDVDPRAGTASGVAGGGAQGVTRSELRRMVGDMLRDHLRLMASVSGSVSTLRDDVNLLDSQDAYVSSIGIAVGGTAANLGQQFRVVGSDSQTHTITFDPTLPAAVAAGDVVDLFNLGGYGFRPQFYDSEIDAAVRLAYPDFLLDVIWQSPTVFSKASPVVTLPDQFVAIHTVEWLDVTNEWRQLPKSRRAGKWGQGWSVDRPQRQLRVDGDYRWPMNGRTLRVRGYGRHAPPTSDGDLVQVDTSWMVHQVASLLAARRNADPQWNNWAVEWGRIASDMRQRMALSKVAGTVFL